MSKTMKSIRLSDSTISTIQTYPVSEQDADFTGRLEEIVSISAQMLKYTTREIAGLFTTAEAKLIVDAVNGLMYTGNVSPKMALLSEVEDSIALDRLIEKWDVDKNSLLDKLHKLTEYQAYTVITLVFGFWNQENPDIEDVTKIFYCKE